MTAAARPTWVVQLTPAGRSAIAVVVVDGPSAVGGVASRFQPARGGSLREYPPGTILLGRWGGACGEDLVVCRRGPERVEVHCHGGLAAVATVMHDLAASGCRQVPWQQWPGISSDQIARQATAALARATTRRTACILLDQQQGALGGALAAVSQAIVRGEPTGARQRLAGILRHAELGMHLTRSWQVVLGGPPNVGKSRLLNRLCGYARAIVLDEPGTTRDVVTAATAWNGWPVELADTAGLRSEAGPPERQGVQEAESRLAAADLVVLVFDASGRHERATELLRAAWPDALWVGNKCDLLASPRTARSEQRATIFASAKTGAGIDRLVAAILRRLVPHTPPPGAAVPFLPEHVRVLRAASAALVRGETTLAHQALQELLQDRPQ